MCTQKHVLSKKKKRKKKAIFKHELSYYKPNLKTVHDVETHWLLELTVVPPGTSLSQIKEKVLSATASKKGHADRSFHVSEDYHCFPLGEKSATVNSVSYCQLLRRKNSPYLLNDPHTYILLHCQCVYIYTQLHSIKTTCYWNHSNINNVVRPNSLQVIYRVNDDVNGVCVCACARRKKIYISQEIKKKFSKM